MDWSGLAGELELEDAEAAALGLWLTTGQWAGLLEAGVLRQGPGVAPGRRVPPCRPWVIEGTGGGAKACCLRPIPFLVSVWGGGRGWWPPQNVPMSAMLLLFELLEEAAGVHLHLLGQSTSHLSFKVFFALFVQVEHTN